MLQRKMRSTEEKKEVLLQRGAILRREVLLAERENLQQREALLQGTRTEAACAGRRGPYALGDVLVRHLLDDGSLASIVKTQHEDACLLVSLLQLAQEVEEAHAEERLRDVGRSEEQR